jgi:hypothetical protein
LDVQRVGEQEAAVDGHAREEPGEYAPSAVALASPVKVRSLQLRAQGMEFGADGGGRDAQDEHVEQRPGPWGRGAVGEDVPSHDIRGWSTENPAL